MEIKINKETCTGCGICRKVCFYDAIEIIKGSAAVNENCVFCGACIEVCKFDSIEIAGIDEEKKDFSDYSGVCIYLEASGGRIEDVGLELVSEGRKLADQLGVKLSAVAIGNGIEKSALGAFSYGLDRLYLLDSPVFSQNADDIYAKALVQIITKYKPEIFLAGATFFGRTLIPKVAAILKTGLTADCTGLEIDREKKILLQTRPTFGGNILATIITRNARPQMATVRPHVMEKKKTAEGREDHMDKIEYIGIDESKFKTKYKLVCTEKERDENINITDYDIIV